MRFGVPRGRPRLARHLWRRCFALFIAAGSFSVRERVVVDTTNFKGYSGFAGTTETLHVVERFTRKDADTLLYEFEVEDPSTWTASWSGDFLWPATQTPEERVYEYACHEGNYAMGNILRGARLLEKEAREKGRGD